MAIKNPERVPLVKALTKAVVDWGHGTATDQERERLERGFMNMRINELKAVETAFNEISRIAGFDWRVGGSES